jgi:5'-deoxy-5'-methylthioadenosine phosphorylase
VTAGALGVIAGTGFSALGVLVDAEGAEVPTAFGAVEATLGSLHGRRTVFIPRHRSDHSVPPHRVNYRANIQALVDLGVTEVLAVNVVGGIGVDTGRLVVVDDFIDFTRSRAATFFDGSPPDGVVHVDMAEPYDQRLRGVWMAAAQARGVDVVPAGVYGAFEGPRFETPAEIRMAASLGVTVVGMTGVPEVVLAAERRLPYSSLCLVVNPAAGQGEPISMDAIHREISAGAETVQALIVEAARRLAA